MSSRLLMSLLALVVSLVPCGTAVARDMITIGQTFLTGSLDPAKGSAGWALVSHGVAEKLFTVDRHGKIVPQLAQEVLRGDDGVWRVALRPDRLFSDGSPVTAAAVATSLNRTGVENGAARASAGRLTFIAEGPTTLSVVGERPIPYLPAVLAEWAFAVYGSSDQGTVFTGAWKVARLEVDRQLDLVPNEHFPGAEQRPAIVIRRFADGQALALATLAGEVDLAFNVPIETVSRLAKQPGIAVKSFPVGYQYMGLLNTTRPALADPLVRRAIDLAIDRNLLARSIEGGMPAAGAFPQGQAYASPEPGPFDRSKPAALLDEAGWRLDGGQRKRDGKQLELELVAYPQRPDLVTFLPVLRSELAKLGIAVRTRLSENIVATAKDGDFDMALWAQHTAPAGDPAFFLNLFFRTGAANNHMRFSSAFLDATLDRFGSAAEAGARAEIAKAAELSIAADAPVVYLLTPVWHVALSTRLATYEPWGSDYFIVRPEITVTR